MGDLIPFAERSSTPEGRPAEPEPRLLTVDAAHGIALALHHGQTDKVGAPYHHHITAVLRGTQLLGGGPDAQIAACFHDAVEDGKATMEQLRGYGATEETLAIVDALTKRKDEPNEDSLVRVIQAGPEAMRVKVSDLLHNTRHDRVEALWRQETTTAQRERFEVRLGRYRHWLQVLMSELGLLPLSLEDSIREFRTSGGDVL